MKALLLFLMMTGATGGEDLTGSNQDDSSLQQLQQDDKTSSGSDSDSENTKDEMNSSNVSKELTPRQISSKILEKVKQIKDKMDPETILTKKKRRGGMLVPVEWKVDAQE